MRAYQEYSEKIREAARRLLAEQKVDVVIGFRKGTVPFMNEPVSGQACRPGSTSSTGTAIAGSTWPITFPSGRIA